jgi:hypothetical protein
MNISGKLYGLLLLAYPREFRRKFAHEMRQVFRDCYRLEVSRRSLPGFWLWTVSDLVVTAAKERVYGSRKEGLIMDRNLLLGSIGIIVIASVLLTFGRRNEVASILLFGYVLDALILTGIVGNVIVFLLNKMTKLDPLQIALWTFGVVHAVPLLFLVLVAGRNDPAFNLAGVLVGYVVSFAIWAGLHLAWRHRPPVYS